MLSGQLSNNDDKNLELEKRHAFNVLKKSETHSGIRHGFGGVIGKVPQINNVNGNTNVPKIFEVSLLWITDWRNTCMIIYIISI